MSLQPLKIETASIPVTNPLGGLEVPNVQQTSREYHRKKQP